MIMHAAGDSRHPSKDAAVLLHEHIDQVLKVTFSHDVLVNLIKYKNPLIKKSIKSLKVLRYL